MHCTRHPVMHSLSILSYFLYLSLLHFFFFFFFNDTATTEIYTLSLHDALPISSREESASGWSSSTGARWASSWRPMGRSRSEEHTSELQSLRHLVCRLLLEKKKKVNRENIRCHEQLVVAHIVY